MSDLEWHGDEAVEYVRGRARTFLKRAADVVASRAKELLSIAGTAVVPDGMQRLGQRFRRKGRRLANAARSQPGESWRKLSKRLRAWVTAEVDEESLEARVGTNQKTGKHLELGTKRGVKPWPWLRPAFEEMVFRTDEILGDIDDKKP